MLDLLLPAAATASLLSWAAAGLVLAVTAWLMRLRAGSRRYAYARRMPPRGRINPGGRRPLPPERPLVVHARAGGNVVPFRRKA